MGRQHRLKEYLIGLEVFNRQNDFDPRVDSIVRVEARRLRMKMEEYYQKEGLHNHIWIELRKGSYVPIFDHRGAGMHDGYPSQLDRRHSIAIGPFTGMDGNFDLVPGIAQKLTHELIKGANFRVLADGDGTTASAADGMDGNGHRASRPDYILEGRLERGDDGLQVLLQLKNVSDNTYVWSDSGHPDGIGSLAGSLNRAMISTIGRSENGRTKSRSSQSESFDYYVKGKYQWKLGTPESIRSSSALFERAVEIDPAYAAAWASLAEAYMVNSLFGLVGPLETGPKMQGAALQASSLAPGLPEAHVAQGLVESAVDWNWDAGERSFQCAIQLDPRDPSAHLAYGIQLASRGMLKAALSETEAALELDPASLATNFILGWLCGISGRHDEAIAQHQLISRLAPDFALAYLGLGWAHLGKGLVSDALAHFTNAGNLFKCRSLLTGCQGHCYGRLNQRDEAMRHLGQNASPVSAAAIYSGLGETGRALAALEQAAEMRDCSLAVQLLNPEFDRLRGEIRFTALLEKMGLRRAPARPASNLDLLTHSVRASA
ncbi:MAG: hypothetical protein ACR2NN_01420 [Bryobacteraceae bacterium]